MQKTAIKFLWPLVLPLIGSLSCAPPPVKVAEGDITAQVVVGQPSTNFQPLGHFKSEADVRNGFGFAVKDHGIITCAHIAARDTMLFRPVTGKADLKMALKNKLEAFDLAVYDLVMESV